MRFVKLVKTIIAIILEALFPLSSAEKEVFSYEPEEAFGKLLKAPTSPVPLTSSVFAYKDERVSRLVWNIKYKKSEKAIRIGGYALYRGLASNSARDEASPRQKIIIPLPITARRRKERGYNQCELLADEIHQLDSKSEFRVMSDLLERVQHKSRQALKGRADRLQDAKGIFGVNQQTLKVIIDSEPDFLERPLIVLDDVITTGSTISEAMETLKCAGFKIVNGFSLAH